MPRVPRLVEAGPSRLIRSSGGVVKLAPRQTSSLAEPPPLTALAPPEKKKRVKASETAGAAWGHMTAPELTKEVKRELLVVKMRSSLDPKKFYRSSDHKKGLPKFFQIGTVVDGGEAGSISKRQQRLSMLNEMMKDEKVARRAKSQFLKVQQASMDGVKRTRPPIRKKRHGKK